MQFVAGGSECDRTRRIAIEPAAPDTGKWKTRWRRSQTKREAPRSLACSFSLRRRIHRRVGRFQLAPRLTPRAFRFGFLAAARFVHLVDDVHLDWLLDATGLLARGKKKPEAQTAKSLTNPAWPPARRGDDARTNRPPLRYDRSLSNNSNHTPCLGLIHACREMPFPSPAAHRECRSAVVRRPECWKCSGRCCVAC